MKYPYLLALAGLAVAGSTGLSQTSVPIFNNSFETPTGSSTYVGFGSNNPAYVTGWTTTNAAGGDNYTVQAGAFAGQDGNQHIEDFAFPGGGTSGGGSVYQVEDGTKSTTATSFGIGTYTLTAYAVPLTNNTGNSYETGDTFYIALASAPTVPIASTLITTTTNGPLTAFSVPLDNTLGTYTGAIVVGFQSPAQTTQGTMEFDNFSLTFSAVPEPSSIAIAALGSFGLLGCLLRRRLA
jgi:hypothetical protein